MRIARRRAGGLALIAAAAVVIPLAQGGPSAGANAPNDRQQIFANAAAEFGVPDDVLLAVSFNESRWETNGFGPSEEGGYGPMNLTDLNNTPRGDIDTSTPALHTAEAAANLIGASTANVESDESANIRAGAALLASYAKELNAGALPSNVGDWYSAVAKYAGAEYATDAKAFADEVFATIRDGATANTLDGQRMKLTANPSAAANTSGLAKLDLRPGTSADSAPMSNAPQCPAELQCGSIDTAYHLFDPTDLGNYCNYDSADRPNNSFIKFIVIHDTEETYDTTTKLPPNPNYCASFNYLVRSADGHVDQALDDKNVAWQAGNWWINSHSVGIEQEGWASRGTTWFSDKLYHSTARLVQYLGHKYDIPLDRAHIIGHDNVPSGGTNPATMHWDPGPYWDWDYFMKLVGAPIHQTAGPSSDVVTIKPDYDQNKLVFSGCVPSNDPIDGGVCGTSPALSSSAVQLRTAPSSDAPLLSDPYIHPKGTPGTNSYDDVGAVAPTGAQYVIADRQGDWTAIWYEGQKAWFYNPKDSMVVHSATQTVTPKSGAVSVYGVAYPTASEIPTGALPWFNGHFSGPLAKYSIQPGQQYVLLDKFQADVFVAELYDESGPYDRTDIFGSGTWYLIWYNHREAFVHASDVDVLNH